MRKQNKKALYRRLDRAPQAQFRTELLYSYSPVREIGDSRPSPQRQRVRRQPRRRTPLPQRRPPRPADGPVGPPSPLPSPQRPTRPNAPRLQERRSPAHPAASARREHRPLRRRLHGSRWRSAGRREQTMASGTCVPPRPGSAAPSRTATADRPAKPPPRAMTSPHACAHRADPPHTLAWWAWPRAPFWRGESGEGGVGEEKAAEANTAPRVRACVRAASARLAGARARPRPLARAVTALRDGGLGARARPPSSRASAYRGCRRRCRFSSFLAPGSVINGRACNCPPLPLPLLSSLAERATTPPSFYPPRLSPAGSARPPGEGARRRCRRPLSPPIPSMEPAPPR